MTWPTDRPGDEVRELAIELALPLDVAERVLAYGKQERRAGYDTALTEVEQGVALPATICNRIDAAVQAEREACLSVVKSHAEYMNNFAIAWDSGSARNTASHIEAIETAIRARGPTSALDAALAQARREGMLAAAREWFTAIRQDVTRMDDEAGWHFDVDSSFPPVSDELGSLLDAMEPPA